MKLFRIVFDFLETRRHDEDWANFRKRNEAIVNFQEVPKESCFWHNVFVLYVRYICMLPPVKKYLSTDH